jgi:uncharacterized protein
MRYLVLAVVGALSALAMTACGPKSDSVEDFYLRTLTFPGGRTIRVEEAFDNVNLLRGLMFRTSLAPERGMLFVYPHPDHYQAVMYQVLIPLDIIWMDSGRRIVQIDENAPPCKTQASKCQKYGGPKLVTYSLEIGGGLAKKYGLQVGQILQW